MYMDLEQFKSSIIPLRQKLMAVALSILCDGEDAEDAVQETLLRLWTMRRQLGGMANPAGFAMQTVKNGCIDRLRTARQTVGTDVLVTDASGETPYTEMERMDAARLVRQIIETLPESQKIIIRLRDIEEYELDEIAAITGTKPATICVLLSRARKKVRDRFVRISEFKYRWK
jgi:RNA polymerase sigma-70 factor (ECF subfamily)